MSNASDFFNVGGGSVPIRGIQEFSSTTPNDYTTPSGERFLKRGTVETNTANFDTNIWNQTWGIVTDRNPDAGLVSISGGKAWPKLAHYSALANEVLIAPSSSGAGQPALISTDGGVSFQKTAGLPSPAWGSSGGVNLVHSVNNWLVSTSNTYVMRSSDSGVSWVSTDTGAGSIGVVMGTETACLVSGTTARRRSTDGGATWSTVASLPSLTSPVSFINGGDWYIIDSSGNVWKSTDDGATWSNVGSTPSGFNTNTFDDGSKLYQIAQTKDYPVELWESSDGITWTDSGVVQDLSTDSRNIGVAVVDKVIRLGDLFIYCDWGTGNELVMMSKDGLNWKDYPYMFEGGQHVPVAISSTKGLVFNVNNSIDTVENILYAGDYAFDEFDTQSGVINDRARTKWVRIS